ncbi:MAG TPA: flavodoxin family protein [Ktedonobacterales bacterium]|nr:flavodoxin family protein [Ktedonobacterales bacterium]
MNALVVYDSQYGNTERIAHIIADILAAAGQARAVRAEPRHRVDIQGVDLLVVGSPTQGWRATQPMLSFIDGMSSERLHGVAVACFDTRFHKPRWLTGSAAVGMARKFQELGVSPLVSPESFFVDGKEGPLISGELDRAVTWARLLSQQVAAPQLIRR